MSQMTCCTRMDSSQCSGRLWPNQARVGFGGLRLSWTLIQIELAPQVLIRTNSITCERCRGEELALPTQAIPTQAVVPARARNLGIWHLAHEAIAGTLLT